MRYGKLLTLLMVILLVILDLRLAGVGLVRSVALPNDSLLSSQWGWFAVGADGAYSIGPHGDGVIVAVLDTGVDYKHPDFGYQNLNSSGNIWVNQGEVGVDSFGKNKSSNALDDDSNGYVDDVIGWNFVKGKEDVTDFDGHGTFVAGIVAARANDGLGIAGVAPDAKVMILKVLSVRGGIWYSVDRAIRYAVNNGAKVINMSFGGNRSIFTVLMRRAIDYAYANGVVLVAASGNENSSLPTFPAAINKTIAASAIDRNMKRAEFSNYGDYVDLTAPGVDILSLTPNGGYANASGTSFATPHVSGVIALLLSKYPSLTPIDVAQTLFTEAKDLGEKGLDPFYGYGLVDALAAVSMEPIPEFRDSGLILVATLLPATFLALRLRRSSRLSKDRHCGGLLRCASPKPAWNRSSSPVKP